MGFWEPLFFWIFAIGAVGSSATVVISRNPLYSALALILDFFFFAGIYGLLSAHFMAITQVLVYAGAIMVLFLFIIMLLNLKDEELGEFEFRIHHVLSAVAVIGMFFFIAASLSPLMGQEGDDMIVDSAGEPELARMALIRAERDAAESRYEEQSAAYERAVERAEEMEPGEARERAMTEAEAISPRYEVAVRSAVKGPLFLDLSEDGLESEWHRRVEAYKTGRTQVSAGKYPRPAGSRPEVIPPSLTGEGLVTDRGRIRAREAPATFGTVEPLSVLLINRFVVPFELTALLLLAAIIGAVIIAKRRL